MPSGGSGPAVMGHDNVMLPWGVESMYELGASIQDIMKQVVEAAGRGFDFYKMLALHYYLFYVF